MDEFNEFGVELSDGVGDLFEFGVGDGDDFHGDIILGKYQGPNK